MIKERATLLFSLFSTFMKIGMFTVGGGYSMLPIIQHEVVDKKKWVGDERMTDYLTLAQASPGLIGTNAAMAVGWHVAGFAGALAATVGVVVPSVVIIVLIAAVFDDFMQWAPALRAFQGARAAVVALMLVAVIRLFKTSVKSKLQGGVALAAALLVIVFGAEPQYVVLASAAAGIGLSILRERIERMCKR